MSKKTYSPEELQRRLDIFKTHALLIDFLTADIINTLVHLFDETCCDGEHFTHRTITGFIEEERRLRGLDSNDVEIRSKAEKKPNIKGNSSFVLDIKKRGQPFIHFTIHLVSHTQDPSREGMLHIVKDIYTVIRSRRDFDKYYALLKVEKPNRKSLRFSIADGYDTVGSPLAAQYDEEVKQEMDVIVAVLNKMFDACNDDYFVGDKMSFLLPI